MMLISRKDQKSFWSLPCLLIIHWFLLALQYFPLNNNKKKKGQNFQPNWPNESSLIYAYYICRSFKTKHLRIILKSSFDVSLFCVVSSCSTASYYIFSILHLLKHRRVSRLFSEVFRFISMFTTYLLFIKRIYPG